MNTLLQVPTDNGGARALDFCVRLSRAQASLTRRLDAALGSVHGIAFGDLVLLQHLGGASGGRLRRVDLAERLALSASGVTRALLPLEKIGLVARQGGARDARVGYAAISNAGHGVLADAGATARMVCQEMLDAAEPDQLDALGVVLDQLAGMDLSTT
ncbi:MAG: MarR family winged helix-turn-helix transcriptional regulator [Pseudomonadota bacterium]